MIISMYRDTAASYGLCEDDGRDDNSIAMDIDDYILESYFNREVKLAYDDDEVIDFEEWKSLYTYDEMEGLLGFIKKTFGNFDCVEVDNDY